MERFLSSSIIPRSRYNFCQCQYFRNSYGTMASQFQSNQLLLKIMKNASRSTWMNMRLVCRSLRTSLDFQDPTIKKLFLEPVWMEYKELALLNYSSRVRLVEAFKQCAVTVFSDHFMIDRHSYITIFVHSSCMSVLHKLF